MQLARKGVSGCGLRHRRWTTHTLLPQQFVARLARAPGRSRAVRRTAGVQRTIRESRHVLAKKSCPRAARRSDKVVLPEWEGPANSSPACHATDAAWTNRIGLRRMTELTRRLATNPTVPLSGRRAGVPSAAMIGRSGSAAAAIRQPPPRTELR